MFPEELLEALSQDVGDFWGFGSEIPILSVPPSSVAFLRDHVCPSIPCIIRNVILSDSNKQDSNKQEPLTFALDDLISLVGEDTILNINVTPDGCGDCVRNVLIDDEKETTRRMFVKPQETNMTLRKFRQDLRRNQHHTKNNRVALKSYPLSSHQHRTTKEHYDDEPINNTTNNNEQVLYFSQQNDCLRNIQELSNVYKLFPTSIPFADEAFHPNTIDAVNLWIGNQHAISSMHKDPYENLFYVASGEKIFTLCPPADVPFLHMGEFPTGSFYSNSAGSWAVKQEEENHSPVMVKWIEPDISTPNGNDEHLFPLTKFAHPITVHVKAGEMIYIPSLWFHRVTQSTETVGVNYWYDMKFDCKWCYFSFLQRLVPNNT